MSAAAPARRKTLRKRLCEPASAAQAASACSATPTYNDGIIHNDNRSNIGTSLIAANNSADSGNRANTVRKTALTRVGVRMPAPATTQNQTPNPLPPGLSASSGT